MAYYSLCFVKLLIFKLLRFYGFEGLFFCSCLGYYGPR